MTASKLQNAALIRFAVQGFDATTMNEIAGDVGIKKASIYAHFRNKDELFLSLIPMMIDSELRYIKAMITGGENLKAQFYAYLESLDTRFMTSHDMQFWLRTIFAPPSHLYHESITPMHAFMDELEAYFSALIADSNLGEVSSGLSVMELTATYMAMMDSLQTELLFGGHEKYEKRFQALWKVFDLVTQPDLSK